MAMGLATTVSEGVVVVVVVTQVVVDEVENLTKRIHNLLERVWD